MTISLQLIYASIRKGFSLCIDRIINLVQKKNTHNII